MDKEKQDWLKEIGATEFAESIKYCVECPGGGRMLYSEKYISETPLEVLRARSWQQSLLEVVADG